MILKGFRFFDSEFIDCVFSGKFKEVIFRGQPLQSGQKLIGRKYNEFHGNDFSGVHFDDTCFAGGIDLSQQILPVSDKYIYIPDLENCLKQLKDELRSIDLEEMLAKIKKAKSTKTLTEEEKLKYELHSQMRILADYLADGQKQFFLMADELTTEIRFLNPMIAFFRKIEASQAHLK